MNSKQEYVSDSPQPKKRSFLLYPLLLLLLVGLGVGSVFIARELLEKGEVRLALPQEVAKVVNDNLSPEKDGRLGPLRVTDTSRPGAPLPDERPAPLPPPPPPPPSSGNVVGEYIKEEAHRPSTSGLVVPPEKSALTLAKPVSPPLPEAPASRWSKPVPEEAPGPPPAGHSGPVGSLPTNTCER